MWGLAIFCLICLHKGAAKSRRYLVFYKEIQLFECGRDGEDQTPRRKVLFFS